MRASFFFFAEKQRVELDLFHPCRLLRDLQHWRLCRPTFGQVSPALATSNLSYLADFFIFSWIQWPGATNQGALITLAFSVARIAFVPLFLFCNASPDNRVVSDVTLTRRQYIINQNY